MKRVRLMGMTAREAFGRLLIAAGEIARGHKPLPDPPDEQDPNHHKLCNKNLFVDGDCDCDARLPEPV